MIDREKVLVRRGPKGEKEKLRAVVVDHGYRSAGDTPAASCFICGRGRSEHTS